MTEQQVTQILQEIADQEVSDSLIMKIKKITTESITPHMWPKPRKIASLSHIWGHLGRGGRSSGTPRDAI
jgi:hypothetical protein